MVWTNTEPEAEPYRFSAPDTEAETAYGFYLEVIPLEGGIVRFPLTTDTPLLIGRSPNRCHLLLHDRRVSRVHLKLICTAQQHILVTDVYSANGSRLDGRALPSGRPITWLINQPIIIGGTHLILRYGAIDSHD